MNIYELHINLMDAVDKISSNAVPEFTINQRDRAINIAIETFIKQRYTGTNVKNKAFEEIQKRTDDLRTVVKYIDIVPDSQGFIIDDEVRTRYFILPTDYWFAVLELVYGKVKLCKPKTKKKSCNEEEVIQEDEVIRLLLHEQEHNRVTWLLEDSFNRPYKRDCFRTIHQNKIQVYYDSNFVDLVTYKLGYIASPFKVLNGITYTTNPNNPNFWKLVNFPMPEHTHIEIINLAAYWLLEGVEQPRQQTIANKIQIEE